MEGEIVLPPKKLTEKEWRTLLFTQGGRRFDATGWVKARQEFDADVEAILTKIDVARHQLGCVAQRRRDERVDRWISAAETTGLYPVLTQD
jgi:hypothetical protein